MCSYPLKKYILFSIDIKSLPLLKCVFLLSIYYLFYCFWFSKSSTKLSIAEKMTFYRFITTGKKIEVSIFELFIQLYLQICPRHAFPVEHRYI